MQFPELSLWRDLLEKLKQKVWTPEPDEPAEEEDKESKKRSKWDETGPAAPTGQTYSAWAKNWRRIMKAVLPRGLDGAIAMTDPEVRKMVAALWADVVEWGNKEGLERHLGLFTAEPVRQSDGSIAPPTDQWSFVPAADLLLVVGEGIVGLTVEGVFADNRPGHEPVTFIEAKNGATCKEKPKKRSKSRSGSNGRGRDDKNESERDKEKRQQQEGYAQFDWESEWRNRANKRRGRGRSPEPSSRYRSRSRDRDRDRARDRSRERRRRRSRSGSRRRSRSGGRRRKKFDD